MSPTRMTRAAGLAIAGLTLLAPIALAQDATPTMGSPEAHMAAPIEVPLADKDGKAVGLATFTEDGDEVTLHILVEGLTPGMHGWHLHETGVCDGAGDEPFSSAGGHWNPTDMEHGAPDAASHHAGDFGNFEATADGMADVTFMSSDFTMLGDGPTSVNDADGTAIIIHAGEDDLTTQPSGDSGARFACGVITAPMADMMGTPMAQAAATPVS